MARESLAAGLRLDRYELLCPLAEASTASVWLARLSGKHGFEKLVTVKAVLPELAGDARFRAAFLDEARSASSVRHANVAQILDLGEEGGVLYAVTEWIDGDSLLTLMTRLEEKGGRLPLGVALRVLADACGGLHAAHELAEADGAPRPVLHRDLSPENVLVNTLGVAKIIDFGTGKAKSRAHEGSVRSRARPRTHRLFTAPEQAQAGLVDRRADVWGVGATLYFLLTGSAPYEGPSEAAALAKLLSGGRPGPLPAGTPDAVAAIVEQTLARPVDRRISSAAELQALMVEALAEQGATSPADVARFVEEHLGDRAKQRKAFVQSALEAAHDRERHARASAEESSRGTSDVSGMGAVAATRAPAASRSRGATWRVAGAAAIVIGSLAGVTTLAFTLANRGSSASEAPALTSTARPDPVASASGAPSTVAASATSSAAPVDVATTPASTSPVPNRTAPPRPRPVRGPTSPPARPRDYGF